MDLSLFQMENGSSRFIGVANAIKLNDLTFADAEKRRHTTSRWYRSSGENLTRRCRSDARLYRIKASVTRLHAVFEAESGRGLTI